MNIPNKEIQLILVEQEYKLIIEYEFQKEY